MNINWGSILFSFLSFLHEMHTLISDNANGQQYFTAAAEQEGAHTISPIHCAGMGASNCVSE
jgi:hypothetical protein